MSFILHLSDLHLAPLADDQVIGDHKSEIAPMSERERRLDQLRRTLDRLPAWMTKQGRTLDAVVISGDITIANKEKGFELLDELLSHLEGMRPVPGRIVIVPGNHDVTWETPPSTPERYRLFLEHVVKKGFVTPALDGIEFDASRLPANAAKHYLWGPHGEWLLLPLNSSNYCGSLEPLTGITAPEWTQLTDRAKSFAAGDDAVKFLQKLRRYDVARISPRQFEVVRGILQKAMAARPPSSVGKPIIIAVMHHHLLPVTPEEEVKPFEAIVNLGLLRYFLRSQEVDVVLHGHKHVGLTYWDHLPDYRHANVPARRVLVISGSTVGGPGYAHNEVCRLIGVDSVTEARTIAVTNLPALDAGAELPPLSHDVYPLWGRYERLAPQEPQLTEIIAHTSTEAYDRLMALFGTMHTGREISYLTCQIHDGASASTLPEHYPEIKGVDAKDRQSWFADLVRWWQRPDSALIERIHFTHGHRIHTHKQMQRIVAALRKEAKTSHGIIALFQPQYDAVDQWKRKFPAFCFVQFIIRKPATGPARLDCIAFFRKQEVRYWWPLNVAELQYLLHEVKNKLTPEPDGLEIGTITTIATRAFAGTSPPRVAVPEVDRLLDDDGDELWSLAYAVFWRGMPDRPRWQNRWHQLLDDLIPSDIPDPDGVPVATDGLESLARMTKQFAKVHGFGEDLASDLELLAERNRAYEEAVGAAQQTDNEIHKKWKRDIAGLITRVRKTIDASFAVS